MADAYDGRLSIFKADIYRKNLDILRSLTSPSRPNAIREKYYIGM
jgi:hypothetical protein